ncbi:H-NS histone family protein [Ramlibacter henchirensis]|uniref:H-NS histone family protein n=1 Tax=Ramlibacter henchirensis TaxID=204072 RepID=A0A4Z0BWH6_9BURK|nr:H-NS histone family protein [Ramlibacter henchirensis]TFZ03072.1 H-NS histone family protein [Ramlibacter henchirensis]
MPTYIELKQQAEKLMAQAEELRQREIQQTIEEIKSKMQAYGITPQDLGIAQGGRTRAARGSTAKAGRNTAPKPIKYRGPNGEAWSGGRGRKPKWVTEALASGKKLEDFQAR